MNKLGADDYAYIPRTGTTVAYYNAGYVRALRLAAQIAGWIGEPGEGAAWTARIAPIAAAFGPAFWDRLGRRVQGRDRRAGRPPGGRERVRRPRRARHAAQATSGARLPRQATLWQPYGAAIADNTVWDGYPWGDYADKRVYPFISYFEVIARYQAGLDPSALALIRREWGYMLDERAGDDDVGDDRRLRRAAGRL